MEPGYTGTLQALFRHQWLHSTTALTALSYTATPRGLMQVCDGNSFSTQMTFNGILPALPHSNRRLVERAAAQHGARLNVVAEVDSVLFTKALVKRGVGQTIQTQAGVAKDLAAGELGAIAIDRPPMMSTLALGMPREGRQSWLTRETARLLRDVIEELVTRGDWIGARMIGQEAEDHS